MPELPDLEIIRRILAAHLPGVEIMSAVELRPLIVRNLLGGAINDHLAGRRFALVHRRGKFLVLTLQDGPYLVFHPMLAGRIRYGPPLTRNRTRDALLLRLSDGNELRYHDARDMGKVYLTGDLGQGPLLNQLGPEADDPSLTLEDFRQRIKGFHGEIKGVLSNQAFVAGIGNAYSDEILWHAGIYPFRRRASLSADEIARLYLAVRTVLAEAITAIEERAAGRSDVEVRDFLAVHGKGGAPCPRCNTAISEVKHEGSATHFCRTCQPGLMVARGRKL
jgi:formamidopyrimidine-DNA glycosylase